MRKSLDIRFLRPDDIYVLGKRRPLNPATVADLTTSIREVGLITPLTIRLVDCLNHPVDGEVVAAFVLVAGHHRLVAAQAAELAEVPCQVMRWTETQARRWEIAENLHRAELTVQERADQIAEWIKLSEAELQSAQPAPIESRRSDKRGHRKEAGINAAARSLGIERTEAQRAVKIASMSEPAKVAARAAGLDNNKTALLRIAAAPAEDQVAAVERIVAQPFNRSAQPPELTYAAWLNDGRAWRDRGRPEWRDLARGELFPNLPAHLDAELTYATWLAAVRAVFDRGRPEWRARIRDELFPS